MMITDSGLLFWVTLLYIVGYPNSLLFYYTHKLLTALMCIACLVVQF